jgi:LacI family transcriptional regulator
MADRAKLEDVAREAGVSLSTASLVLSDSGRISAETRERVLESALRLGYLKRERKIRQAEPEDGRVIAILLDVDQEWAFALTLIRPIIQEFERSLLAAAYHTVLIPISGGESPGEILLKVRASGAVGVATIHIATSELVLLLEAAGVPVVVIMNSSFQDRFYTVCVDDFQGAYEGTSYLIKSGHLRLGYVDCERHGLPVLPVDRFFGFKKAIEEYHLDFDDSLRRRLPQDDGEAAIAVESLVRAGPGITALFVLDDELGARVITLLGRAGVRVPEDLSILAPGDVLDYSRCYVPQITTMRIDTTYMGRIAGQMMLNRITHNPQELHVLKVKQLLVRRESVRENA